MNLRAAFLVLACAAAHAAVPGLTVATDSGRIDLYEEAGPCVGQARRAEYVPKKGDPIAGCGVFTGQGVRIVLLDGDSSTLPAAVFQKPVTY